MQTPDRSAGLHECAEETSDVYNRGALTCEIHENLGTGPSKVCMGRDALAFRIFMEKLTYNPPRPLAAGRITIQEFTTRDTVFMNMKNACTENLLLLLDKCILHVAAPFPDDVPRIMSAMRGSRLMLSEA